MSRLWLAISIVLFLSVVVGCSGTDGGSPLVPPDPESELILTESDPADGQAAGHVLWGFWQAVVDLEARTFEIVPLRGAGFHMNLSGLLGNSPGALAVKVNSIDIPQRLLDFDLTLTHPVPDSDLRGFDVRGILMGPGDTVAAESDPSLIYSGLTGTRLLNADGYTRWWNAVEFSTPGPFGYSDDRVIPGFLVPETTLNPYKYFSDPLGPDDPVVPGVDVSNRGTFSSDLDPPSNTRNYLVRFPVIGGKPKLGFHYAIDASYAPPTGSSATPKPVEDYPPWANCPEPFHINANTEGTWAYYESESNRGGDLVMQIEVFDWGAAENPDGILGEIVSILIESPTLFDGPRLVDLHPLPGSQTVSAVFNVVVPDVHPTGVLDQQVLIAVQSRDPKTYAPPTPGHDYPEQAALAAYNIVDIPIYTSKPPGYDESITIISPDSDTEWTYNAPASIAWSWTGDPEDLAIDLSLDGGENFDIPIAGDVENDGWLEITVGDWTTDHAVLKITTATAEYLSEEFTVSPSVTVTAPNGGEYWIEGNTYELTWAGSSSIENVMILLSDDSGSNYMYPVTMATPNDGSFLWYIDPAFPESNHSRIKVVDALPTTIEDESDGDFTIFPENLAQIRVVAPNGNEVWKEDTGEEITWDASPDIVDIRIELSLDGGATYPHVVADFAPNTGSFAWDPIPTEAIGESNRIRISNAADPTVCDVSNALFSVKPMGDGYIELQTPVKADEWQIGCSQPVEWQWDGIIPSVNILFSVDSLGTYSTIVDDVVNVGSTIVSFEPENIDDLSLWDTTELPGKLRVEASDDPALFDEVGLVVPINLGILYDMVQASAAGDADHDNIPDDVEMFIGTDPADRDCDIPNPDSMFDNYEVFGDGYFDPYDLIPDQDKDGVIAPLDMDDNGDGVNDGEEVDTDLDGIPNYLEYYGYTFDWMSGTYNLWDGSSIDEPYYKTDPLQPSTDQDPYSDSMEVSGAFMDVSVEKPGDYPMVPAYPNIVVRLEGYDVTLNQEITLQEGKSIEQGTEWSTETSREHSYEFEHGWEVSGGTEFGYDGGGKFVVQLSGSYGQTYHNTNTNSVTKSVGSSMATGKEWSQATCTNPTDAAHFKLYLKVYNHGTSCASNIVPTITLKIGSRNVATFPTSTMINILEPGGVYPSQSGTFWVIDNVDGNPIALTLDELRALECGAPVSIVMTQMSADVMLMNESGQWESAGDWGEYMARCESVCSNMFLEIGEGNFLHYLVYSDDEASAPQVTFGDAVVWAAGAATTQDDLWITYIDESGQEQIASLQDWDFCLDAQTLIANGFTGSPLQPPTPDYNLKDLVLSPNTQIIGKIPREDLPDVAGPQVIYAYFDDLNKSAKVLATDYSGISNVEFIDNTAAVHEMSEVISGSGLFTLQLDSGYAFDDTEVVRAYSLDTSVPYTEADVEKLVYPDIPEPVAPYITEVGTYLANRLIRVQVSDDPDWPTQYVTAQWSCTDEVVSLVLGAPYGYYPDVWYGRLPDCVTHYNETDILVKAGVTPEVFCTRTNVNYYHQPLATSYWEDPPMSSTYGYKTENPDRWVIAWYDLDGNESVFSPPAEIFTNSWTTSDLVDMWEQSNEHGDVFLRPHDGYWLLNWIGNWHFDPIPVALYQGTKEFRHITLEDCKAQEFFETMETRIVTHDDCNPVLNTPAIFIYRTTDAHFGRLRVREVLDCYTNYYGDHINLALDWLTFADEAF